MGCAVGTVKSTLHAARVRLEVDLGDNREEVENNAGLKNWTRTRGDSRRASCAGLGRLGDRRGEWRLRRRRLGLGGRWRSSSWRSASSPRTRHDARRGARRLTVADVRSAPRRSRAVLAPADVIFHVGDRRLALSVTRSCTRPTPASTGRRSRTRRSRRERTRVPPSRRTRGSSCNHRRVPSRCCPPKAAPTSR